MLRNFLGLLPTSNITFIELLTNFKHVDTAEIGLHLYDRQRSESSHPSAPREYRRPAGG